MIRCSALALAAEHHERTHDVGLVHAAAGTAWGVLADGMGGLLDPEEAGHLAVVSAASALSRGEDVQAAIWQAHQALLQRWTAGQAGAAIVAAQYREQRLAIAHVGDCRAYLVQASDMSVLTADHSRLAERLGRNPEPVEVRAHPRKASTLSRCLGDPPLKRSDVVFSNRSLRSPALVLLATDGAWLTLTKQDVLELAASADPPTLALTSLIHSLEERDHSDDIGVV